MNGSNGAYMYLTNIHIESTRSYDTSFYARGGEILEMRNVTIHDTQCRGDF